MRYRRVASAPVGASDAPVGGEANSTPVGVEIGVPYAGEVGEGAAIALYGVDGSTSGAGTEWRPIEEDAGSTRTLVVATGSSSIVKDSNPSSRAGDAAPQSHDEFSSNTTSRETWARPDRGWKTRYAADPGSYPRKTMGTLRSSSFLAFGRVTFT